MQLERARLLEAQRELTISCFHPARVLASATAVRNFARETAGLAHLSFWDSIRILQHKDIAVSPKGDAPQFVWYEGAGDVFSGALCNLMGNVAIPGEARYSDGERGAFEAAYLRAVERFSAIMPMTYIAFVEVIAFVIFARRNGYSGGTVSSRVGLIWLAPDESWSEDQWLENLVHEFVHNCLFLEDMIAPIFLAGGGRLEMDDALATSAIRRVRRGYDKSYHSAFVSLCLVEFYLLLGRPLKAREFLDPLLVCADDLSANMRFITEHGQQLLVDLAERVLSLERQVPRPVKFGSLS